MRLLLSAHSGSLVGGIKMHVQSEKQVLLAPLVIAMAGA
jgi:hypothetical protein